ncbi:MAG: flagellar M-ring protein FliF, partial [Acidobacteria bacterium]
MDPKQFLARFKSLASSLTAAQIATLGVAFLAIVVLVGGSALFLGSSSSSYRLLFSDMDAESAAGVVSRLESLDVPYTLQEGGRAIRVPADRVDALRLEFSSQGLPASGRIGFEIFDRTAFGATEFLEHVNYRRALEGEIARTIATLSEVSGARVHISMAKESLFSEREQPAKASVVLSLKNRNRPLSVATVTGIGRLVAASVEGLRPEAVVIVDNYGRPLARPQEDGVLAGDGVPGERQQQIEHDMARRVVSLLEPVVGENRVRANVTVRLNTQSQEETEERWDPSAVIRSRQVSAEGAPGGAGG